MANILPTDISIDPLVINVDNIDEYNSATIAVINAIENTDIENYQDNIDIFSDNINNLSNNYQEYLQAKHLIGSIGERPAITSSLKAGTIFIIQS